MKEAFIAPIVEGHGEVYALPALLHRIRDDLAAPTRLIVNPPIRVKVNSLLGDQGYLHRYLTLATEKARSRPNGSVLVLVDDEDGCPRDSGPALLIRCLKVCTDVPITVVMAHREYETWFVAAGHSLRGCCGLPADLEAPEHPEGARGAKEWLGSRMAVPYDPTNHQLLFTRAFDLAAARRVSSFARLYRKMEALLC